MKKLKQLFSALVLFAFLNTANAQQIEQEIISFVDDTEVLINNGRRMMLQYVQARNFERVAEIYHFLNERTSEKNCAAFTISEELHIAVLTNNWENFFAIAEHFSSMERINLCAPIHDNLLTRTLHSEVENNASQLFENALAADLTLKEKQLLELYFYVVQHGVDETYRRKLRAFRREHSQSEYNHFVRNYLPDAPIRWATGFSMGAVQVFPTGNFSSYFAPATGFHFSGDFSINRFYFGFQGDIASMRLNLPLLRSATGHHYNFQTGDRLLYEKVTLSVGYTVMRNNRFELTPLIGIGGTTLRSNLYLPRYRNAELTVVNSFSVTPGLRAEFQLAQFQWYDWWRRTSVPSSINLRFDVGYNIPTSFNYTQARGNTFYARVGIVWWSGNL